jgi:hypothetical protein
MTTSFADLTAPLSIYRTQLEIERLRGEVNALRFSMNLPKENFMSHVDYHTQEAGCIGLGQPIKHVAAEARVDAKNEPEIPFLLRRLETVTASLIDTFGELETNLDSVLATRPDYIDKNEAAKGEPRAATRTGQQLADLYDRLSALQDRVRMTSELLAL